MNKAIPIIIGSLVALIGGIWVVLQSDQVIEPAQIQLVEFDSADITFVRENAEFVTTTDEFGNTIRTGLRIPMRYNFPIATTTGYIVQEIEKNIEMNFDGYNMCRGKGGTKLQCLKELRDDIESNVEAFQINLKRDLEELKRQAYQEEIIF